MSFWSEDDFDENKKKTTPGGKVEYSFLEEIDENYKLKIFKIFDVEEDGKEPHTKVYFEVVEGPQRGKVVIERVYKSMAWKAREIIMACGFYEVINGDRHRSRDFHLTHCQGAQLYADFLANPSKKTGKVYKNLTNFKTIEDVDGVDIHVDDTVGINPL